MNISEKLKMIQKISDLSQEKLAQKIGVSFASLNSWVNQRSNPRKKYEDKIDELYKELTGQKIIPEDELNSKKIYLVKKSKEYEFVSNKIIANKSILDEFVLSLTYNSNKIEGSTLTKNETADILFRDISLPDKKLVEQLEAKNHQTALLYAFKMKPAKIDEKFILKLHSILMNGIRDDAGIYRRVQVRIVGSNVPTANFMKVPDLMSDLNKEINKNEKDIIKHITHIHSRFEQIHPFSDGNGRIGRILMNLMLLRKNFPPAVIKQENKSNYYTYLQKSQQTGDNSLLENFLIDAVIDGFKILEL